jgi:hypothetical protein
MARKKSRAQRREDRLTAEERMKFVKQRQRVVGSLICQPGWGGALVVEHIKGSQYLVRLSSGEMVFASHKKPKEKTLPEGYSESGWKLWEER